MPLALQKKLCDQLAQNNNRCENGSTITYLKHVKLTKNRLLLFVYLNEHSNRPYNTIEATATPLLINHQGKWISSIGDNTITENIDSIHQDPHDNIWVRTHWQIEGVSPAYYHSKGGIKWKRTILPKNRNVDCCFENVDKPIFLYNTISLTFRGMDNKNVKSWSASYQNAMSNKPIWQPIHQVPKNGIELIVNDNNWRVKKTHETIIFSNDYSDINIVLPKANKNRKKIYQIQVGAYTKKTSIEKVRKSLLHISYPIFTKKAKKYTKLLIGEFTDPKKAKFILEKLKQDYPQNKNLQKAFVLVSPK